MDEFHLLAAVSYVSLNPVRAGMVGYAADWAWSSVRAHLAGLVRPASPHDVLEFLIRDFPELLP